LVAQKVTDVMWGGFFNLYVTDRRLIVEKVMGSAAGAVFAAGIVGLRVASDVAQQRGQRALALGRTPEQVLRASPGNYAIDYAAITKLVLTRNALPIGHTRCKVTSTQKNVTLAFKREYFDQVAGVMRQVLHDRVEIR
jgi:hypothetical protein